MTYELEREELERLRYANDGVLLVDDIVEAASQIGSPLHKHFTWDDTEAARRYRQEQARALVQKCRVTMESRPDVLMRAYVSVASDRTKGGGYRAIEEVLDDEALREELVNEMRQRIAYWQRQHHILNAPLKKALQQFEQAIEETITA